MNRPENLMPPEQYYNGKEAMKYTNCTRIIQIQSEMAERCLELIGIQYNRELSHTDDSVDHNDDNSIASSHISLEQSMPNDQRPLEEPANDTNQYEAIRAAPLTILDVGCGSGLSGELIYEYGHLWWGLDISSSMLEVAQSREA